MKASELRRVIKEVLPNNLYSSNAEELLILTAATESLGGTYLYQMGKGPARGIFQMEPATEKDILINYVRYKPELRQLLSDYVTISNDGKLTYHQRHDPLTYNIAYQVLMARIHYLRDKQAIPSHKEVGQLADYWKRVYNTSKGKGIPSGAMFNYYEYIGEKRYAVG